MQQSLKEEWNIFWGFAPQGTLKDQKGKDVFDWWLSKTCKLAEEAYNKGYEDGKIGVYRLSHESSGETRTSEQM